MKKGFFYFYLQKGVFIPPPIRGYFAEFCNPKLLFL
nr:MAG TPA: hypothetical protein [Caudoviricetes sp.]